MVSFVAILQIGSACENFFLVCLSSQEGRGTTSKFQKEVTPCVKSVNSSNKDFIGILLDLAFFGKKTIYKKNLKRETSKTKFYKLPPRDLVKRIGIEEVKPYIHRFRKLEK